MKLPHTRRALASGIVFLCAAVPALTACASAPVHYGATSAKAERVLVNRDSKGVALQGYDPVAYFTIGKPTKGSSVNQTRFMGATYYFASSEHKRLFDAEPDKYTPAFGGYCGYAASINRLSPISPEYWEIIDGRLVLQHNKKAWDAWHTDVRGNLVKANDHWPDLVAKNGSSVKTLINVDDTGLALQGYDPVAYFTDGAPKKGSSMYQAVYDGGTYYFTSQEHREMFEREPSKYAPQFGGYCAYAASINKISPVNPLIWQVEDGRLCLQHTEKAYRLFNKDPQGNLQRADTNWPGLVEKRGK